MYTCAVATAILNCKARYGHNMCIETNDLICLMNPTINGAMKATLVDTKQGRKGAKKTLCQ